MYRTLLPKSVPAVSVASTQVAQTLSARFLGQDRFNERPNVDFDSVLAVLLEKHESAEGKWDLVASDFLAATGTSRCKQWFKKRAKKLRPGSGENAPGIFPMVESTQVFADNEVLSDELPGTTERTSSAMSQGSESHILRIHVLQYSRHPRVFRDTLLNGEPLRACRQALSNKGMHPELPSGVMIFVRPEHFELVTHAIQDMGLTVSHVLASDEFVDLVSATVSSLPSRAQVREKSHRSLSIAQPREDCELVAPILVARTFLYVPLPSSLWSGPASSLQTASTTNADPRKPGNPRACGPASRRHLQAGVWVDADVASIATTETSTPHDRENSAGHSSTHIAVGAHVEIFGLVSQTGRGLNGRRGKVVNHNSVNGRWGVQFPNLADAKQIKACNLRVVELDTTPIGVLSDFLHYVVPFDAASPEFHGWKQVKEVITLCYVGHIVVYCGCKRHAAMINDCVREMRNEASRCIAIADEDDVPFESSRVVTLINFGESPSVTEYTRRVLRIFTITNDWPEGEPRGLVVNVTASSLSPPYTTLNTRDWSSCGGDSERTPWVSVFRTEHPESLHDTKANTFDKSTKLFVLEQAGIYFKALGSDEGLAGGNIKEWHLMLGHYCGERSYMYHTDWSWIEAPSIMDEPANWIKVNMADLLHPNPYHRPACDLDSLCMQQTIRIPQHLSVPGVMDFINRQRRTLPRS